jgi:hypothetical protein
MRPIALLLCAWIVWAQQSDGGTHIVVPIAGWPTFKECFEDATIRNDAYAKRGNLRPDEAGPFRCYPDTIDVREDRALRTPRRP